MKISANHVTFARLVAMPFLAALLYGGHTARTVAMILGTAVGLTDMLDGYLARKHGPTVLGGMMDPIADKVFVVTALLPLAHIGWAPWWLVYVILVREFVVTALRSSVERREESMRSTYLAKVKTWVQMLALGFAVAVNVITHETLAGVLVGASALALLLALSNLRRGRAHRGPWYFVFGISSCAGVDLVLGDGPFMVVVFASTALITWLSALDYLALAARHAREAEAGDLVRFAGALALPVLAALALQRLPELPWAIVAIAALEVAHGGLDNLLAHEGCWAPAWAWGSRSLGASALLGAAILVPGASAVLLLVALAVTLSGTTAEFWRNRRAYLDPRPPKTTVSAPVIVRH